MFVDGLLSIVFQVRQHDSKRPKDLINSNGAQSPRFLMMMQKIDEINDLQGNLCDLEVVQYHIIMQHLRDSPMMIVKHQ